MFNFNSALLRELIRKNNLNIVAVAKKSQLVFNTVKKLTRDGARANLKTIGKIAAVFNVKTEEFILH